MKKQLIKIPNLYDAKNNNLLGLFTKTYKLIFKMCRVTSYGVKKLIKVN